MSRLASTSSSSGSSSSSSSDSSPAPVFAGAAAGAAGGGGGGRFEVGELVLFLVDLGDVVVLLVREGESVLRDQVVVVRELVEIAFDELFGSFDFVEFL